uniref:Uncharacterized protein n=1 Tax=Candidatus Kentrum sp. FW TaxID=2126338 RepID=A0A450SQ27_9GAMM|nr:MAG: hypothetical protein BECKFW1821B_GA0114236_102518 [Candidatus Kentron sp. FW]
MDGQAGQTRQKRQLPGGNLGIVRASLTHYQFENIQIKALSLFILPLGGNLLLGRYYQIPAGQVIGQQRPDS